MSFDAHATDHGILRELVRITARPPIARDDTPNPHPGPESRSRFTTETAMTAPTLPPRPRRPITVYLRDDVLDQLDLLVEILPDAPNRSRLIESFCEMQLTLLLNPAEALPLVLQGILNSVTAKAIEEIEAWRVPDLKPDTETTGTS